MTSGSRRISRAMAVGALALVGAACFAEAGCDGTMTGVAWTPRVPEPESTAPLPVASGSAAARAKPARVGARHLLVMYKGSRSAPASIQRSRDEARARAEEALARAVAGEDFAAVVAAYTDEPGGAARGGDLGTFGADQMVRAFSEAAFALERGQTSGVVETPFGFHVIRRTE